MDDVSFDRKTVTFPPNAWRRLKTASSFRAVPLWPQLEEIFRPYVFGTSRPPGGRVQDMLIRPSCSAQRAVFYVSAFATVAFLTVPKVEQMRCGVPGLDVAYAAPCSPVAEPEHSTDWTSGIQSLNMRQASVRTTSR